MSRIRPWCAVLALAASSSGCVTAQPDVGQYSPTAASPTADQQFRLPRDRKVFIASVPGQPACAVELLLARLRALGISIELPRDRIDVDAMFQHQRRSSPSANDVPSGLDDAFVLAVLVDALEGPTGGWRPMQVMDLKSAHRRSDVGLAVYDGRSRTIPWSSLVRTRRVLQCEDPELQFMIDTIVARIE